MTAYYNEHDPVAAAWLMELIEDGLIAPGIVDQRSIVDVKANELVGYTQCHFFAGIGIWSLALRRSGWPDDRPVWTGSCPCQPFSSAGKGGGFDDERHLLPAFAALIRECGPDAVFGEQVSSKDALPWIDALRAYVEGAGYALGVLDTCAAGVGAPHIRQRFYWAAQRMGHAEPKGLQERELVGGVCPGEVCSPSREVPQRGSDPRGLADSEHAERRPVDLHREDGRDGQDGRWEVHAGPVNGLWGQADWLLCRDGKWRPVEPSALALADAGVDGGTVAQGCGAYRTEAGEAVMFSPLSPKGRYRNRTSELRGAGNAINLAQAEEFVRAFMEA